MKFELVATRVPRTVTILDIGGEGRHPDAWNLNPSRTRTLGPSKGSPIPRYIEGKAEAIPLQNRSVELITMERTPLRRQAVHEILRVISINGTIILQQTIVCGPVEPTAHASIWTRVTVRASVGS